MEHDPGVNSDSPICFDPLHTAVIAVDVQNDFFHAKGAKASYGFDIGANLSALARLPGFIEKTRRLGCLIVFLQTTVSESTISPAQRTRMTSRGLDPVGICREGTWGAEIHPDIGLKDEDVVVKKYRYSGFVGTRLDLVLRSRSIDTLIVVGTSANACVDSTARDASMRDYNVIVGRDLVGWTLGNLAEAALENLAQYFAMVWDSSHILDSLSAGRDGPVDPS